jgi:hypothetical protein
MIIAGLVHSLLKAIHEWTACGPAVPTYLSLLRSSWVRIKFSGGHIHRHRERDEAAGSMSGWSRMGSCTSLVQFRVLGLRRITREFLSTPNAVHIEFHLRPSSTR